MTDKPQWQGVTLYLVTDDCKYSEFWHSFALAAQDWRDCEVDANPHVWELQVGQAPVDVTAEARKLVEA